MAEGAVRSMAGRGGGQVLLLLQAWPGPLPGETWAPSMAGEGKSHQKGQDQVLLLEPRRTAQQMLSVHCRHRLLGGSCSWMTPGASAASTSLACLFFCSCPGCSLWKERPLKRMKHMGKKTP